MARICPRCGQLCSTIRKKKVYGRYYWYAVHTYYENGKRKFRYCYLGPADGYRYSVQPHPELKHIKFDLDNSNENKTTQVTLNEEDKKRLIKCYLWHKKYRRRRIQKIFEEVIFPLVNIDPNSLSE